MSNIKIIYQFWMFHFDFNHQEYDGYLYARRKNMFSTIPILQKDMEISLDGNIFKIDKIKVDRDQYDYEDNYIEVNDEIEIDVYVKYDSYIEDLLKSDTWIIVEYPTLVIRTDEY